MSSYEFNGEIDDKLRLRITASTGYGSVSPFSPFALIDP
jgi:hypothetical protein